MEDLASYEKILKDVATNANNSVQQLESLVNEKPIEVLTYFPNFILTDGYSTTVVLSAIIHMSHVLKPTVSHPIELVNQIYDSLSEDSRNILKQAFFRGLMYEKKEIRDSSACGIRDIVRIEIPRGQWPDFFEYIDNVFRNGSFGEFARLGALATMKEIFAASFITTKSFKSWKNAVKIVYDACTDVLISDAFAPLKVEAVLSLIHIIKQFPNSFRQQETWHNLMQLIVANFSTSDDDLHSALFSLLSKLFVLNSNELNENIISSLMESIAPSITCDNSRRHKDVVRFLKAVAKHDEMASDTTRTFTYLVAPQMLEFLFFVIQTGGSFDDMEATQNYEVPYEAFKCVTAFAKISTDATVEYCSKFFNENIHSDKLEPIIASLAAVQALIFVQADIIDEFVSEILPLIFQLAVSQNDVIAVSSTYVLSAFAQNKPHLVVSDEILESMMQVIFSLFKSNRIRIGAGTLMAFNVFELFDPFSSQSFIGSHFETIFSSLFESTSNPEMMNDDLLFSLYDVLSALISKLPISSANLGDSLVPQALDQLKAAESGIQKKCATIFIDGCCRRFPDKVAQFGQDIAEYLIQTLSSKEEQEITFIAISSLCSALRENIAVYFPRVLPIIQEAFNGGSSSVINSAAEAISSFFTFAGKQIASSAVMLSEILYTNIMAPSLSNYIRSFLLSALSKVLIYVGGDIVQMIDNLMILFRNLTQSLPEIKKLEGPNAACAIASKLCLCYSAVIDDYKDIDLNFLIKSSVDFFALIKAAHSSSLFNSDFLQAFCVLIKSIIGAFGRQVNLQLNSPTVKDIMKKAIASRDRVLSEKAKSIEEDRQRQ